MLVIGKLYAIHAIVKRPRERTLVILRRYTATNYIEGAITIMSYQIIKEGKKQCSKCGEWELLDEFNVHKKQSSGFFSACRECENKRLTKLMAKRRATIPRVREQELIRQRARRSEARSVRTPN